MKQMKKLTCLLLSLLMILSLGITALAAEGDDANPDDKTAPVIPTDGTIVISNADPGQKFNAYQLLKLESFDANTNAYSYQVNPAWRAFFESADAQAYTTMDSNGYVTWTANNNAPSFVAGFAQAAMKWAKDHSIAPSNATPAEANASGGATISNLERGYYLVDSTMGSLVMLNTTDTTMNITEKNLLPTNVKKVKEDDNNTYGDKNDAAIGETIDFMSTLSVNRGMTHLVFHDEMSEGLTLDKTAGSISVSFVAPARAAATAAEIDTNDYTIRYKGDTGVTDNCAFEIEFKSSFFEKITEDATPVYITYKAALNEKAVINGAGNSNTSKLEYSNIPNKTTTPSNTTTYTWEIPIYKFTKKNGAETPLAGAEFKLCTDPAGANAITFAAAKNADGIVIANEYKVDPTSTITTITTDDTGKFKLQGLDRGTYYLFETKAPDGYNVNEGSYSVRIDEKGVVYLNSTVTPEVKIENNSGTRLPSTGGIGTTLFYILGGVLVAAAGVLLVTKKRMSAER